MSFIKCRNDTGRVQKVKNTVSGSKFSLGPGVTVEGEGWDEAVASGVLTMLSGAFRTPPNPTRVGTTTDKISIPDGGDDLSKAGIKTKEGSEGGDQSNVSEAAGQPPVVETPQVEIPKVETPTPVEAPQEEVIPEGWVKYIDEGSGKPYYQNIGTGLTQWEAPIVEAPDVQPTEETEEAEQPLEGSQGSGFDPSMTVEARNERINLLGEATGDGVGPALRELYLIRDYIQGYEEAGETGSFALVNEQLVKLGADANS